MRAHDWSDVAALVAALEEARRCGRQVFLCGNGGSAANAIHLANDFLHAASLAGGGGLRASALPANAATLTCLANDTDYAQVFSLQLAAWGSPGDVLIALSGSGNSPNIVRVLEKAREIGLASFAILGFSGGRCLRLAEHPIHFQVDDMQVAEDLQLIVGHMAMQQLCPSRPASPA